MCLVEIKVLQGYRVILPKEVRRKLRIERGDVLKCELRGREVVLRAEHIPASPTIEMLGLAAGVEILPEQAVLKEVEEKLARSTKVRGR